MPDYGPPPVVICDHRLTSCPDSCTHKGPHVCAVEAGNCSLRTLPVFCSCVAIPEPKEDQ